MSVEEEDFEKIKHLLSDNAKKVLGRKLRKELLDKERKELAKNKNQFLSQFGDGIFILRTI